ncbi:MAG: DUF2231 domain-containing protein [Pyrinomonadaceae bacterium]
MASKASIAGHPVHPMLIPFPLALWVTSFVADVIFYFNRNLSLLLIAKFTLAAGILGGLAAAVPGIIDWLAIKDQEVKRIANWHARLNIIALLIFAASLYLRTRYGARFVSYSLTIPFLLSLVGVILIGISGWLGGDLVYKHGVSVAPQHDSPEEEKAKVREHG